MDEEIKIGKVKLFSFPIAKPQQLGDIFEKEEDIYSDFFVSGWPKESMEDLEC